MSKIKFLNKCSKITRGIYKKSEQSYNYDINKVSEQKFKEGEAYEGRGIL